jgi:hypothetical protein
MSLYQNVLFIVFTAFFILIGVASFSVLLGFFRQADPRFRRWAIPGFFAGVTTAMFGLFRLSFLTSIVPIMVTLVPPDGGVPPILKSGKYHYDEVGSDQQIVGKDGPVIPVLGEGGWQVQLPGEVSNKPLTLQLQDESGGTWQAGPFYPNYVRQQIRAENRGAAAPSPTAWHVPGVALVSAAEPGREAPAVQTSIRFDNYARRIADQSGHPYYQWVVFVNEPPATLDTITQVDYVLHPTFPNPFQTSRDRAKRFELDSTGWGEFTILITVHLNSGRLMKTSYALNLKKGWPPERR